MSVISRFIYIFFALLLFYKIALSLELKYDIPDLCYRCHATVKLQINKKYIHLPFKQGKCLFCHQSHASGTRGLLVRDVNNLCIQCHKEIKNHGFGTCLECHTSHSSDNKNLLNSQVECLNCHKFNNNKEFVIIHKPYSEKRCLSCHNPHSKLSFYLKEDPRRLCLTCHQPKCRVKNISIAFITQKMNCITCHSGHNSKYKGLFALHGHSSFYSKKCGDCHNEIKPNVSITLRKDLQLLCLSCHKDISLLNNDIHYKDKNCSLCHYSHASYYSKLIDYNSFNCVTCHQNIEQKNHMLVKRFKVIRCEPLKNNRCLACHTPPHSKQAYYLKGDKIEVCVSCHKEFHKVSHPLKVNDPRNGEPMNCLSCHSMHNAKAEFLLTHDRKRALCIQCHVDK